MKEKSVRDEDVEVSGDRRRSAARILIGIQILMALALVVLLVGSRVLGSIEVDLPRPREQIATRSSPRFLALRNQIYQLIGPRGVG